MALKYGVQISSDVSKLAKELMKEYKMTPYEALDIALKAEQNELLTLGFVISRSDSHPTGLEAIAIAKGYKYEG